MLSKLKAYGFLLLVGGLVIIADQAIKAWIIAHIGYTETWHPIPAFTWLSITNWHNHGMAFGLGQTWGMVLLALGLVYGIVVFTVFPAIARSPWYWRWGMALQWGGALGNLLDRLRQGYVTDYVAVGRFPVFNLADAAISISVVILLLGEFLEPSKETVAPTEESSAEPSSLPEDLHATRD